VNWPGSSGTMRDRWRRSGACAEQWKRSRRMSRTRSVRRRSRRCWASATATRAIWLGYSRPSLLSLAVPGLAPARPCPRVQRLAVVRRGRPSPKWGAGLPPQRRAILPCPSRPCLRSGCQASSLQQKRGYQSQYNMRVCSPDSDSSVALTTE
jgi:hypothetical protein